MRTARRNWTTGRVDACRAEPHPSPSPARRGDGEELRGEGRSDPVRDDQRAAAGRYKGLSRPPANIGPAGEERSRGRTVQPSVRAAAPGRTPLPGAFPHLLTVSPPRPVEHRPRRDFLGRRLPRPSTPPHPSSAFRAAPPPPAAPATFAPRSPCTRYCTLQVAPCRTARSQRARTANAFGMRRYYGIRYHVSQAQRNTEGSDLRALEHLPA